jgi:hypothetical protein
MSMTTHSNDFELAQDTQTRVSVELPLADAEALHTWMLRANADGVTALDEPPVSAALAALSRAVDDAHVVMKIRRELTAVGISEHHLSDQQVRELGRRVAQTISAVSAE